VLLAGAALPGDAGAVLPVGKGATTGGLCGIYNGPFWPHADSRLVSIKAEIRVRILDEVNTVYNGILCMNKCHGV
jgi:hypothetical protein